MYDELKIDDNDPYKDNVVKENFCGACLALPLAFAGAGTATATSGDGGKNGGKSNLFFWSVIITIIGLIVTFWYLSGDCKSCVSPKASHKRSSRPQMSFCSKN